MLAILVHIHLWPITLLITFYLPLVYCFTFHFNYKSNRQICHVKLDLHVICIRITSKCSTFNCTRVCVNHANNKLNIISYKL